MTRTSSRWRSRATSRSRPGDAATLPRVYAYVFSRCGHDVALAEDVTQQAFIAGVEQRSRFDGRSDSATGGSAGSRDTSSPTTSAERRGRNVARCGSKSVSSIWIDTLRRDPGSTTAPRSPMPFGRSRQTSVPSWPSSSSTTFQSPRRAAHGQEPVRHPSLVASSTERRAASDAHTGGAFDAD